MLFRAQGIGACACMCMLIPHHGSLLIGYVCVCVCGRGGGGWVGGWYQSSYCKLGHSRKNCQIAKFKISMKSGGMVILITIQATM